MVSRIRSRGLTCGILITIFLLALAEFVFVVIRFRLVKYVTGSLIGQSCANLHPYDPAEHTYLILITLLSIVLMVVSIVGVVALNINRFVKILLTVLSMAMVVVLCYSGLVWTGGLELSNKQVSDVDPCQTGF